MYLSNESVHVFPISFDRASNPMARALSEDNIRSVVKSMSDQTSFVVSSNFNPVDIFEFVVDGYYVKLTPSVDNPLSFTSDDVYAVIFLDTVSTKYPLLYGSDTEDGFSGVIFVDSIDESLIESLQPIVAVDAEGNTTKLTEYRYLQILHKGADGSYSVPDSSRTRFNFLLVDGGEIE